MARITNTKYFNLDMNITDKQHLDELINYVNGLLKMKDDTAFQSFIKNKCVDVLNQIMQDNLIGGTTNDDALSLYMGSNHVEDIENGFIMYNDAKISANAQDPTTYPDGQFSIALAFEYGVGIIGQNTNNPNAWEYNVNNYNFGWYYKNEYGQWVPTGGYEGFQIYTLTANEIESQLPQWVNEYIGIEV